MSGAHRRTAEIYGFQGGLEREKFMLGKCDRRLRLSPSFVMENRHFTNTYTQSPA